MGGPPSVILGGPCSRTKGTQESGPHKRCLNFLVQSIQKQLKKVQDTNTETNEEVKGN